MRQEAWPEKAEREAAERVSALLALPYDDGCMSTGECFEPWELFPSLYGTYCGSFDRCAIEVLTELRDGKKVRDDLGAEMFREMLCTAYLCNYGTSPRVCFPSQQFKALLPALVERWKEYSRLHWGVDIFAEGEQG